MGQQGFVRLPNTKFNQNPRQEVVAPKLVELYQWMKDEHPKVTPISPIGKALLYSMKRWKELSAFISDGRLEIDNNKIENTIRPIALGRKTFYSPDHMSLLKG